ncbi:hypothetical protein [Nocardioides gansuensis]|uniref:hypothetical protein n=1 Tax=Nocardioides gansuensis TaxID=2138300 RepID=UPI001401E9BB|nr:hypothetical protein [Nocardioides gansuensis]
MDDFSRRVLLALVVAASGPGAAMLSLQLIAPTLIAVSVPQTEGGIVESVGSGLAGA